MVDTKKLRGIIAENGMSQSKVAKLLGLSPKGFYDKMKRGVFDSDEMEQMIDILSIENPVEIFLQKLLRDTYQNEIGIMHKSS